uniref:PDZ domain-containing protein n=1 Tax=Globodera rostochiensis TaxID=31243 RepID=A0A914H721_GLORO
MESQEWFTQQPQSLVVQKKKLPEAEMSPVSVLTVGSTANPIKFLPDSEMSSSVCVPVTGPKPRLCTLIKERKGKGHFIDTNDKGCIGDRACLKPGQRIAGVNGVLLPINISHKACGKMIKQNKTKTDLLVVLL